MSENIYGGIFLTHTVLYVCLCVAGAAGRVAWSRHGEVDRPTTTPGEYVTHYVQFQH